MLARRERDTLRGTRARRQLAICPPIRAANIVARAVSPTSAATSTRFAAATMPDATPRHIAACKGRGFAAHRTDRKPQSNSLLVGCMDELMEECDEAHANSG